MQFTQYKSPFNYSNYDFIIKTDINIKDSIIQFAETNIERAEYQIVLSNILNNIKMAIDIETSIFEYALIYSLNKYDHTFIKPVYKDKFYFIISNLEKDNKINNISLKKKILNNEINPKIIAFMSPSQIFPEKWENIIKKKEYIELRENNVAYSDTYKCKRCGEAKCKISLIQTRSGDEPMTTFVSCLVCHNTTKYY